MPKILVADDSWLTRRLLSKILAERGYEVLEAVNGVEALATLETGEVACALLDLVMPEIDGYGVLQAVRDRDIRVPIIVLTADIQTTTRTRCESLGASAILNKPAKNEEILEALRASLARTGENAP